MIQILDSVVLRLGLYGLRPVNNWGNMKRILWFVLGCLVVVSTTHAASFECAKAASKIEKLICEYIKLATLSSPKDRPQISVGSHDEQKEENPIVGASVKRFLM
jgi:hypothetical protein